MYGDNNKAILEYMTGSITCHTSLKSRNNL